MRRTSPRLLVRASCAAAIVASACLWPTEVCACINPPPPPPPHVIVLGTIVDGKNQPVYDAKVFVSATRNSNVPAAATLRGSGVLTDKQGSFRTAASHPGGTEQFWLDATVLINTWYDTVRVRSAEQVAAFPQQPPMADTVRITFRLP